MAASRVHLLISGRVQGVAFRHSTKAEADVLGLSGWVRNLDDGRVEALAEGPRETLETFVAWCHRGPPSARVAGVAVTWSDATGEHASFAVRH